MSNDIEIERPVFQNQQELISFLETLLDSQDDYTINIFARKTLSPRIRHTNLLTHSFLVINLSNGEYHTLSYSSENFGLVTNGTWVLNKETDISSFRLYITGNNIWDVVEIFFEEIVDVRQTIINIKNTIGSNIRYYYRDHVNKIPNYFNCNTAIRETLAFRQ